MSSAHCSLVDTTGLGRVELQFQPSDQNVGFTARERYKSVSVLARKLKLHAAVPVVSDFVPASKLIQIEN